MSKRTPRRSRTPLPVIRATVTFRGDPATGPARLTAALIEIGRTIPQVKNDDVTGPDDRRPE